MRTIYHMFPMWVWEALILTGMIGMFLIMCMIGWFITDLFGGNENERTDNGSS